MHLFLSLGNDPTSPRVVNAQVNSAGNRKDAAFVDLRESVPHSGRGLKQQADNAAGLHFGTRLDRGAHSCGEKNQNCRRCSYAWRYWFTHELSQGLGIHRRVGGANGDPNASFE